MATFSKKGLKAAYVTGETGNEEVKSAVMAGHYQLVFFTPELIIDTKKWHKMLSSTIYSERLRGFVVDEAHCVAKW